MNKKSQWFSTVINRMFYNNFDEDNETHLALDAILSSLVHIAALTENPHYVLDQAAKGLIESKSNGFLEKQQEYIKEYVKSNEGKEKE